MSTPCWQWTGATNQRYGHMRPQAIGIEDWPTVLIYAHHAAWVLATEHPFYHQKDLLLLHHCDNKLCVNPEHLYWGTPTANLLDAYERGQMKRTNLTADDHREIRRQVKRGTSAREVAKMYGVSIQSCHRIARCKQTQKEKQEKRQEQISTLHAQGKSNQEIAALLHTSREEIRNVLGEKEAHLSLYHQQAEKEYRRTVELWESGQWPTKAALARHLGIWRQTVHNRLKKYEKEKRN